MLRRTAIVSPAQERAVDLSLADSSIVARCSSLGASATMKIRMSCLLVALVCTPGVSLQAATLVVNDLFDGTGANDIAPGDGVCFDSIGACTLRAAIEESNALAGIDNIEFAVDGTITVSADVGALPQITGQLNIDATTAPGYPGSSINLQDAPPSVYLSGAGLGGAGGSSAGLRFSAGPASFGSVRALGVIQFATGIRVSPSATHIFIDACYIGVRADGTAAGNATGIFLGTNSNIVGRVIGGFGNVISSNSASGININSASDNLIGGNRIGTAPNGIAARGNGIGILGVAANNNQIGVYTDALDLGNLVSGNLGAGIQIIGNGNDISANRIGLSRNGFPLANAGPGVNVSGSNNQIGGTAVNAFNEVSGNTVGVLVDGAGNEIAGNEIGVAGLTATVSGNSDDGIRIAGGSMNRVLNNGIFNSGGDGIDLLGTQSSVQGNQIGFAFFPGSRIDFGSDQAGIRVRGAGSLIGTVQANSIGFSGNDGIRLESADNVVANNYIGVSSDGQAIGNQGEGIQVGSASSTTENNAIFENEIAFSQFAGVGLTSVAGQGNVIYENRMYANGDVGIDLNTDGATPNDPDDADTGPNNLQNYPTLVSAVLNGSVSPPELSINWQMDSAVGNSAYPIVADFYLADSEISGEGRTYLSFDLTSAPGLDNPVTLTLPIGTRGGFLVATATDLNGTRNTSEFSIPLLFGDPQTIFSDGFESP